MPAIYVRAARLADIPSIAAIHEYYTLNTVITFKLAVTSEIEHIATFDNAASQRLPFLVAVDRPGEPQAGADVVAGYAYCTGFRSGKAGYSRTAELSLFCAPAQRGRGVGTALLNALLRALTEPEQCSELFRDEGDRIRQLIACMAVDIEGQEEGWGLKRWYERFGFVQRAHLTEVGFKFGRWIDTVYLQKTLW